MHTLNRLRQVDAAPEGNMKAKNLINAYRRDYVQLDMFVHTTRNKARDEKGKSEEAERRAKASYAQVHKERVA